MPKTRTITLTLTDVSDDDYADIAHAVWLSAFLRKQTGIVVEADSYTTVGQLEARWRALGDDHTWQLT